MGIPVIVLVIAIVQTLIVVQMHVYVKHLKLLLRGQVVNILEASGDPGLHAVEWTLERMGSDQGGRGAGFSRRTNLVQPGEYTVILGVNDAEHRMPLRITRRQP